jgi:hypothetical protein
VGLTLQGDVQAPALVEQADYRAAQAFNLADEVGGSV